MNIFTEYEDFFGKSEVVQLSQTMQELIDLAVTVRQRLGERGYLFDKYFCCLLQGAGAVSLFTAADDGFSSSAELRALCKSIAQGETTQAEHPLYKKVREYISAHPFPYQETYIRHSLYYVALACDFTEYASKEYAQRLEDIILGAVDLVGTDSLYNEICTVLGGEIEMERFNLLFRQRFLSITIMAGFLQGLTDNLIAELSNCDAETSKQVVQLWLDECEK